MNWKEQSVFVTGACGFIGSHLVEALVARGARVRALAFYDARGSLGWIDDLPADVRKSVEVVSGDVRDTEQMRSLVREGEVVFHLAALIGIPYSYVAPRSYVETNVTGTLNVIEACRRNECRRLLVVSTSEVYGSALRVPIPEDHPLQAQSPYSASKIGAEKIAESYVRSFGTPIVVARPFNTYGPRQSARAVIPTILMQLLNGSESLCLGDQTPTRDFNFAPDTVEGLVRLAECDAAVGRVVNIGTGSEISVGEVAKLAQRIAGRDMPALTEERRTRPAASEVMRLCADNTLLKRLSGWAPPARIEEGLTLTLEWMKKEKKRYDPHRYYI